jgi:DNA-binding sugar fermentation-stimulating protein
LIHSADRLAPFTIQEHLVAVERLAKGRAFHDAVQSAFLTGLANATGFRERCWRLTAGGRGRVDLAVVTDDREKMLIIIEIKGTDWDKIRPDRVKRNVQRHIRQLLAYLDTAIGELEAGQWEGIAGALLYPSRPASAESVACIEAAAAEQAIMVT